MKKHPPAFSRTTAIDEMIRDSERAKRRSNVHEMMATVYASKPTLSQKQFYDYGMHPTFGEAAADAEADAAEEAAITLQRAYRNIKSRKKAAITIQRAYRNIKSRKSSKGKGGKRQIKKRNSR
jgi:hypothetical protein